MMTEQELRELQDTKNWDWERAEQRPGDKPSKRVVVSVAFSREEFEAIAEGARRIGMKTSEFIRHAALDRAKSNSDTLTGHAVSSSHPIEPHRVLAKTTRRARQEIHEPEPTAH